jgi:hypothetical protein
MACLDPYESHIYLQVVSFFSGTHTYTTMYDADVYLVCGARTERIAISVIKYISSNLDYTPCMTCLDPYEPYIYSIYIIYVVSYLHNHV